MEPQDSEPSFGGLGLHPTLLRTLEGLGYERPTPIQARAIPPLLEGHDILGQAQTGTGKTAAFALPLLQRLDLNAQGVQAIVLTPTRELALQVAEAVRAYGRHLGDRGVHVLPVYGGQPMHIQLRALRRGVHVVVGTPGRVKDHLERKTLRLNRIRFFGLDEADEMLNMGFIEDVEWILEQAPPTRQVALFSATLPPPIRRVIEKHLRSPVEVRIEHAALTVPNIEQLSLRVPRHAKNETVVRVLEAEEGDDAILIFTRTKNATEALAEHLQSRGFEAEFVHGGLPQKQREAVVQRLRIKRTQILVATDVAARGLDIDHIGLVINYDLPRDLEVYVHRVGRTARAGRTGRALSLWEPREQRLLANLERFTGLRMSPMRIPGQAELVTRKRDRFADEIRSQAVEELGPFTRFVESLAAEEGLDLARVAAALARLVWGDGPLVVKPPPPPEKRGARRERGRGNDRDRATTQIVLAVGRQNGVRPGEIVGAITGETGLDGSIIGGIRITERVTFVSVADDVVRKVFSALGGVKLRGRPLKPRLAYPSSSSRKRR